MTRRELAWQLAVLAMLAAGALYLFATTQANLARLGVDSGFEFLWRRAGFEIDQRLIAFSANDTVARAFVVALLNTLVLAASAIACASTIGLLIGIARLSRNALMRLFGTVYVEAFRNIPSLLQIFFWYYVVLHSLPRVRDSLAVGEAVYLNNRGLFLPWPEFGGHPATLLFMAAGCIWLYFVIRRRARLGPDWRGKTPFFAALSLMLPLAMFGIGVDTLGLHWDLPRQARFGVDGGLALRPEFLALVVGLSLYHAAYIGEIVRSAFAAIPRGQLEAADSLGLSRRLSLRLIVFPQALRLMIPPLTTVWLNMFKGTSLAAAIAYPEVVSVFVGTVNNIVGQPVAIMAMTLLVYSVVSFSVALLLNWYNRRLALRT
jgi:general L-amino acid transport system permease protein